MKVKLKKMLGVLLCLVLLISLMPRTSIKIKAASFEFDNCISDTVLYPSGCLKSMKIKIVPNGSYAQAYGKIAIHSKKTQYNWENRYLNSGQSDWSNVNDSALKSSDGLVAWSAGSEFCWTNWNTNTSDGSNIVTVNFNDGDINLNSTGTFYIYLWTRSSNYGIYTDGLIGTLNAGEGQLKVGETVVADTSTVDTSIVDKSELITAISNATSYYNSIKGTYADIASALNTAISNAQAVVDNTSATEQEVYDAVNTLNTAKTTAETAVAAATSNSTENVDYSFTNCYDCQRSPAWPKKGDSCTASGFTYPLVSYRVSGTTSSGNWTLSYIGLYKDITVNSDRISEVANSVSSAYGLTSWDNVPIYELKDGNTHIAYGSLCALAENNGKALFIGDTWNNGAGYVLSNQALSASYNFNITTDINDIITEKTGGGTQETSGGGTQETSSGSSDSSSTENVDYSFTNCYDCQRSPEWPKKGDSCTASVFTNPLVSYKERGTTSSGNWTLSYIGLYKDITVNSNRISEVANSVSSAYGLTSLDNVPIYELKDGNTHIAYGSLCALAENNGKALFIGDNWDNGAGYVLSDQALSTSYVFRITTDINDIITEKTGGGTQETSSGSSDSSNTGTDTKVLYQNVETSQGFVKDITGTEVATAESNPFNTKIENNNDLKTLLSLTDAEVAEGVNVWLDIQDMSDSVPQTDKALIQNASDDYEVGIYLDINIFMKVGNNDATKVTETNGMIKASLIIPENLRKSDRTFEIIRVHDDEVSTISGTYDESTHVFTFETDKFSTYALAYKDNTSLLDSENALAEANLSSGNDNYNDTPNTGDPNELRVWVLLILASIGGIGFIGYNKKRA